MWGGGRQCSIFASRLSAYIASVKASEWTVQMLMRLEVEDPFPGGRSSRISARTLTCTSRYPPPTSTSIHGMFTDIDVSLIQNLCNAVEV